MLNLDPISLTCIGSAHMAHPSTRHHVNKVTIDIIKKQGLSLLCFSQSP